MVPWDRDRFKVLEEKVTATLEGKRPTIDVPFYVYLYDPVEETLALERFTNLVRRLRTRNYSADTIWLSEMMVEVLERLKFLDPKGVKLEQEDRDTVKEDLERVLPEELASRLKERLKGRDVDHCAVLLRCGSLFPFAHVSSLLFKLTGSVNCTLVIPYPGNKEGRMLHEKGESVRNYYRAEII